MRCTIKMALIAVAMGTSTLGLAAPVMAQVVVVAPAGGIAFGYSDGYWDHDHQWHRWQSTRHRQAYQHAEGAEYHAVRHTRAANQGWHDRGDHHDDHH